MISIVLLSCILAGSLGKLPLIPGSSLGNIEQVVDSVSRIADGYFPVPIPEAVASASENVPRFARQALPLMPYRYGYAVQDDIGNDFNQQEQSDGDQVTGQYSVLLPDGRIQTVTYSVRPETGFVAEVTYS